MLKLSAIFVCLISSIVTIHFQKVLLIWGISIVSLVHNSFLVTLPYFYGYYTFFCHHSIKSFPKTMFNCQSPVSVCSSFTRWYLGIFNFKCRWIDMKLTILLYIFYNCSECFSTLRYGVWYCVIYFYASTSFLFSLPF